MPWCFLATPIVWKVSVCTIRQVFWEKTIRKLVELSNLGIKMSWTENSGTKRVLWRIRLPKTMVPENLAMIEFWLSNCIEIGEIGLRFWNKDLKWQIWSVAPLSKIQEKGKTKPMGFVVHWWTTIAVEEEALSDYWIKARRASYCYLEKPNWALALSSFPAPRLAVEETISTILAWVEGLEGGGWTLVCRLQPWGTPCLIQQES